MTDAERPAPPGLWRACSAIERDHEARVLAVRDMGSRAWNLAGPDSDYDVLALFVQRRLLDGDEPVYVVERATDDGYLGRPAGDPDAPPEHVPRGRYREATTDRTVKRVLYVVRGILYAQYVRATGRFPPLDFPAFDPALSLVAAARALADRKRAGDGDGTVEDPIGVDALPPERIDPERYARPGPDRDRVNAFVERALADSPDG